ncbi:hypothetical protein [Allomesorhizobium alhagi]|jgi:predicted transcriptional regulator|uniref:Uncharacterized protein n=1 Tax=Mesorhizobium alhagi CCNWXJ12-2 TaxID=1107882 RepID=H0HPM0_9HYPH|nr:hypothetical protein [Mesorhizobium alhagi]EHK57313.1 hypothetical protein MAXJ12_10498 [Mesorhizobium alhagi CCNWXJ12-2]
MNATLKNLLHAAETWTPEEQAELADFARVIEARRTGIYELDEDELAAVEEGLGQADRGEFVTDGDLREMSRRFGA